MASRSDRARACPQGRNRDEQPGQRNEPARKARWAAASSGTSIMASRSDHAAQPGNVLAGGGRGGSCWETDRSDPEDGHQAPDQARHQRHSRRAPTTRTHRVAAVDPGDQLPSRPTLPFDVAAARILAAYRVPEHAPWDDALIAAVAQSAGMTVVARNIKHFEPLGVACLNPWDAKASQG